MSARPIPGSLEDPSSGREFRYLFDDGSIPFKALFRKLMGAASPLKAKHGGAITENCKLQLPDGSCFQALSYRGDVESWRDDIERAARRLGLAIGVIQGDRLVISEGRSFALADCTATFY